jgi:hypothetical protein
MFIPRIHHASPKTTPRPLKRRLSLQRVIDLERLEVRTPLSAGLASSVDAHEAFAPPIGLASESATAVVVGPPVSLAAGGPAAQPTGAPAHVQWDTPQESQVLETVGLLASPIGGDGLRPEAVWAGSGLSGFNLSAWSGGLAMRDVGSTYSSYFDGLSFGPTPIWLENSARLTVSSEFLSDPYESNNWFVANSGMPDPFGASDLSVYAEITVSAGAGPFSFYSATQLVAPSLDIELTVQYFMPTFFFDPESFGLMPGMYGPGDGVGTATSLAPAVISRSDTSGSNFDPASTAAASAIQTTASSSLQMMAFPIAGGRATNAASTQSVGGLAIQVDHTSGPTGAGWMSYMVGGDWGSGGVQTPGFSAGDSMVAGLNADESLSPATITDGSAPLSVLLTGPEVPTQTTSDDLEQVAELIPPSESSLALVATLWTVPSDNSTRAQWDQILDASPPWFNSAATTPSSTAYLIGLDQAFEQSRRDIQRVDSVGAQRLISTQRDQVEFDRQLEWERPIVPAATGWVSDRIDLSLDDKALAVEEDAAWALAADQIQTAGDAGSTLGAGARHDASAPSEVVSFVTTSSLPLLSALSASTAITGWLWSRRNRKRRLDHPVLGT